MASDWPDKQDWESLSAAVRAEANAAMIEEWYQKGEKSFCEFVQDMARKPSDRQVRLSCWSLSFASKGKTRLSSAKVDYRDCHQPRTVTVAVFPVLERLPGTGAAED